MEIIKKGWFFIHKFGMYFAPFLWIYSKYFLVFYIFVILSWKLNKNKYLISEYEYLFFNETFIGKGKKYYVPKKHRYILYINFLLGILYYVLTYKG